jgi:hypothetical protein
LWRVSPGLRVQMPAMLSGGAAAGFDVLVGTDAISCACSV